MGINEYHFKSKIKFDLAHVRLELASQPTSEFFAPLDLISNKFGICFPTFDKIEKNPKIKIWTNLKKTTKRKMKLTKIKKKMFLIKISTKINF